MTQSKRARQLTSITAPSSDYRILTPYVGNDNHDDALMSPSEVVTSALTDPSVQALLGVPNLRNIKNFNTADGASVGTSQVESVFRVGNTPLNGGYVALCRVDISTGGGVAERSQAAATLTYNINGTVSTLSLKNHAFLVLFYENDVLKSAHTVLNTRLIFDLIALDEKIDALGTQGNGSSETANSLTNTDTVHFQDFPNDTLNRNIVANVQIPNLIEPSNNDAFITNGGKIRVRKSEPVLHNQGVVFLHKTPSVAQPWVDDWSAELKNFGILAPLLVSADTDNMLELGLDGLIKMQPLAQGSGGSGGGDFVDAVINELGQTYPRMSLTVFGAATGATVATITQAGNTTTEITFPTPSIGRVKEASVWFDATHYATVNGSSYCFIRLKNVNLAARKQVMPQSRAFWKLPNLKIYSIFNTTSPGMYDPYDDVTNQVIIHVVEISDASDSMLIAIENANSYPAMMVNIMP
jgi:hypothetical protein